MEDKGLDIVEKKEYDMVEELIDVMNEYKVHFVYATKDGEIQNNAEFMCTDVLALNEDSAIQFVMSTLMTKGFVPCYVGTEFTDFSDEEIFEIIGVNE